MSPGEYQELTAFFIERLDGYQRETRAGLQDLRSFIGVSVESLRHEIRIVADGVLEAHRRIDRNTRALEEHSRRLDENTQRLDEHGRRLDDNTRAVDALTERVGRLETTV
jgi:CII-binding regulator of phage lambda lysogenization HflD